ncbi:uncharacterized protein LOC144115190 isoform X2 [Amblyomma americanum]
MDTAALEQNSTGPMECTWRKKDDARVTARDCALGTADILTWRVDEVVARGCSCTDVRVLRDTKERLSTSLLDSLEMATCKRHKGHLHESIWTPQLGLAPRLALLLFLIGKKPRLQEAVMLAPQADPVVVVPKYRLNLFLIGKKPRLQEAVMLAPRADPVVVVPKYRLNLSGLFTPNWSDAPALLDQRLGNHGCWCAYRPLAATQAPWSRRSATLEPHRMAINWKRMACECCLWVHSCSSKRASAVRSSHVSRLPACGGKGPTTSDENWGLPRWTRLLRGYRTGTRGEPPS